MAGIFAQIMEEYAQDISVVVQVYVTEKERSWSASILQTGQMHRQQQLWQRDKCYPK